jgi:hypothetical protein
MKLQQTYSIPGRKSELSIESKLLIYKTILKLIWTYGITLWGTASNSNIEILQTYQNKVLQATVNAPWYTSNKTIHADLRYQQLEEKLQNSASNTAIKQQHTQTNFQPHFLKKKKSLED